jgi:hypothetical protein
MMMVGGALAAVAVARKRERTMARFSTQAVCPVRRRTEEELGHVEPRLRLGHPRAREGGQHLRGRRRSEKVKLTRAPTQHSQIDPAV